MSDSALLVLDLQRDFLEDAGRMPIARQQVAPLLDVVNTAIDSASARQVPVVYIVNEFPRSQVVLNFLRRGAAVEGTPGAELDPRVHRAPGAPTIPKGQTDAFGNPALDAFLRKRGVKHITILGVFAPHCVRATARGAIRHGYGVSVLREGVGAASDGARDRALRAMARDGATIDAFVESTA